MIRRRQCQNLMRAAMQLTQGADTNDAEVITRMADYLEAHNAQMRTATGPHTWASPASPPPPPMPQSAHRFEISPGKFEHLHQAWQHTRHLLSVHAGHFLETLLGSHIATDLAAYCFQWQLDYYVLHAERGALFSLGAEAYLAHVMARDAAGMLPQLMDERATQPSSEGLAYSSDTAEGTRA